MPIIKFFDYRLRELLITERPFFNEVGAKSNSKKAAMLFQKYGSNIGYEVGTLAKKIGELKKEP